MDLADRLLYLAIGCMIGFILGYIVRGLREIKDELDEVDDMVRRNRGEEGIMRFPIVADVMLVVVVCLTAFAAFSSQKASNEVEANQRQIANVTRCNQDFLAETITALNERTSYSVAAAQANVELQKAQRAYVSIFDDVPPPTEEEALAAFQEYFNSLDNFVTLTGKVRDKSEDFPYPTTKDFQNCLYEE